ncbi:MAG: DUF3109 family protein [Candidatus Helarchaeota archaeon]
MNDFKEKDKYIVINGIKVEKELLKYHFECIYNSSCKSQCCDLGAFITKEEIRKVRKDITKIKEYLSINKQKRLSKLHNKFVLNNGWKDLWKTRTWNGTCIFLMDNGGCSIHKFCLDNNINWIKYKFNICVTFPLDIRPHEKTIEFMEDWNNEEFDIWCLRSSKQEKIKRHIKPIIYSMKEIIVDRLGLKFWNALEKKYKELKT